jgi:hypothetical protein
VRSQAAAVDGPKLGSMIDHCFRCLRLAPSWDSSEYLEWHELTSAAGEHLGLVCVDCLADEQLVAIHVQHAYSLTA